MAGRIANQGNIVQNGLLFSIDPSKPSSYPKTGSVITNITNTSITGSLINGPTYDSSGYGSILLDGVNDYIELNQFKEYMFSCTSAKSNQNIVGAQTINLWIKISSTAASPSVALSFTDNTLSNYAVLGVGNFTGTYADESFGVIILDGVTGISVQVYVRKGTTFYYDDKWHNFVYTTSATGNKVYVDGVEETVTYNAGNVSTNAVFNPYNVNKTSVGFLLGARQYNGVNLYTKSNCGYFSVYNRALSAQEVTQNFNAMKGRYGL
jgi:hypothetical protein